MAQTVYNRNDAAEHAVSEESKKLLGRLALWYTLKTHACTLLVWSWDVELLMFLSDMFLSSTTFFLKKLADIKFTLGGTRTRSP